MLKNPWRQNVILTFSDTLDAFEVLESFHRKSNKYGGKKPTSDGFLQLKIFFEVTLNLKVSLPVAWRVQPCPTFPSKQNRIKFRSIMKLFFQFQLTFNMNNSFFISLCYVFVYCIINLWTNSKTFQIKRVIHSI